jgi:shikimate dehydrogenase
VNAVRRDPDGRLVGDLFDGRGFVDGLIGNGIVVSGKRAFVAGAGGAAYAVSFALARAGAAGITVHNRTPERAEELAARLALAYPALRVATGFDLAGQDLAINTTPVGLGPGDPPSFDPRGLPRSAIVAEVLMKPEVTPLLAAATSAGYRTHAGRHMLDFQVEPILDFLGARAGSRPRHAGGRA